MNLNESPRQLHDKGWIIGNLFNKSERESVVLKIVGIGKEIEV
jgi:hypothetical protein